MFAKPCYAFCVALYEITSTLLLPFRAEIEAGGVGGILPGDRWPTVFVISYRDTFDLVPQQAGRYVVPVRTCTFLGIRTSFPFNGTDHEFLEWLQHHAHEVMADHVLPRLNAFLLSVKRAHPDAFRTSVLRNIGDVDLMFSNLVFGNDVVLSRGSSTFFAGMGSAASMKVNDLPLDEEVGEEWKVMTRAVDLVNHGYYLEGLTVAFALLDAQAQEFLTAHLPNLTHAEAHNLLRKIETERLATYFGSLMLVAIGESLTTAGRGRELSWLNQKRNRIMHGAEDCSRRDAQRGLRICFWMLWELAAAGAELDLPDHLSFWTE